MINGENTSGKKAFYNLRIQQLQLAIPVPHLQFTRSIQRILVKDDDEKHDNNESNDTVCEKKEKTQIERIYENKRNIIRVCGNVVTFENKLSTDVDVNTFEFCDQFSYNGGGCLKLITRDHTLYHRCVRIYPVKKKLKEILDRRNWLIKIKKKTLLIKHNYCSLINYITLQIIFGSHRFEAKYPGDRRLRRT